MTTEEKVQKQLEDIKTSLETSQKDKLKAAVDQMQAALETKNAETIKKAMDDNLKTINDGLKELGDWRKEKTDTDKENQKALDNLIAQIGEINKNTQPVTVKSFGQLFSEALEQKEHQEGIQSVSKNRPYKIELFKRKDGLAIPQTIEMKTVGDMITSSNLTGDGVATYSPKNALLKGHRVNFRDLIPTTYSPTGLYVHYSETGGEGSITRQTEGSSKSQIDYDFTEVKTASSYVAGFARFSKQMMRNLPWLNGTLPRLLLRDFYKNENALFWATVVAAATGSTTTVESADEKQLIDLITNQLDANFDPTAVLISNRGIARILKNLATAGYYLGSGSIVGNQDGSIKIMNTTLVPANWVSNDKVLIYDADYLERIEVESIAVEFFEQDSDNATKNKITARIECLEEINPMLGSSLIYADMGNASF